jgi:xanthine dehydrogenase C subunit
MKVRRPARFEDVFALMGDAEGTTRLAAGATALQLEWAMGKAPPDILVDISALPGMGAVSVADDRLRIGACVTLNSLIADDRISGRLPMLHTALGNVAAPAVRNLATIGGNVAGRTGCLLPALLCLDAEVESVASTGRSRQSLADWLAAPAGELIAAILLPLHAPEVWTFRKIGRRAAFSASVINVAAALALSDGRVREARLAVGGGIVPPARLPSTEGMLAGQAFDAIDWSEVHAALMAEIDAPDNVFRSATYRRRVAANALVAGLGGAFWNAQGPGIRRTCGAPSSPLGEKCRA